MTHDEIIKTATDIGICWVGFNVAIGWLLVLPSILDWLHGGDRIYAHSRPHPYLAHNRERPEQHTQNTKSEKEFYHNNVLRFEPIKVRRA